MDFDKDQFLVYCFSLSTELRLHPKIQKTAGIKYADDTAVFNKGSTEIVEIRYNATLAAVANWFFKNKLTIKTTKTKLIIFGIGCNLNKRKPTIDREEIEEVRFFRNLGIILDNQLKFKDHINYFKKKFLNSCSLFTGCALFLRERRFQAVLKFMSNQ